MSADVKKDDFVAVQPPELKGNGTLDEEQDCNMNNNLEQQMFKEPAHEIYDQAEVEHMCGKTIIDSPHLSQQKSVDSSCNTCQDKSMTNIYEQTTLKPGDNICQETNMKPADSFSGQSAAANAEHITCKQLTTQPESIPPQKKVQALMEPEIADPDLTEPTVDCEKMKTSDYYKTKKIPERFEYPGWFHGYGYKRQHPMYRTTSADYGSRQPTVHTVPTCFHARTQKFSNHLGKCGMYRNHSLNTALDDYDKAFI